MLVEKLSLGLTYADSFGMENTSAVSINYYFNSRRRGFLLGLDAVMHSDAEDSCWSCAYLEEESEDSVRNNGVLLLSLGYIF